MMSIWPSAEAAASASQPTSLPFIDYILVHRNDDLSLQTPRDMFEAEIELDGLVIMRETIDKCMFVKVTHTRTHSYDGVTVCVTAMNAVISC